MKNYSEQISNWFKYQRNRLKHSKKYLHTHQVIEFLQDGNTNCDIIFTEQERASFINYLSRHLAGGLTMSISSKYRYLPVKIIYDSEKNLPYVITEDGDRLYFKRGLSKKHIKRMYNNLRMEQDKESPHNYCFNNLRVTANTIVGDIGAAEGIFTLKFIDTIKRAYLFEADPEWIEALQATFEPWKEKITIVNKFVSDENDKEDNITLDDYFNRNERPTLLKLDVEGAEKSVLGGATSLLQKGDITDLLVSLYHRKEDAEVLPDILRQKNYTVKVSSGYMLMMQESGFVADVPFEFRKGVCHAFVQSH